MDMSWCCTRGPVICGARQAELHGNQRRGPARSLRWRWLVNADEVELSFAISMRWSDKCCRDARLKQELLLMF